MPILQQTFRSTGVEDVKCVQQHSMSHRKVLIAQILGDLISASGSVFHTQVTQMTMVNHSTMQLNAARHIVVWHSRHEHSLITYTMYIMQK